MEYLKDKFPSRYVETTIDELDYSNEDEVCPYEACENPRFLVDMNGMFNEPLDANTGLPVELGQELLKQYADSLGNESVARAIAELIYNEEDEVKEANKGIGRRLLIFKD